jgi:hypothetical protein
MSRDDRDHPKAHAEVGFEQSDVAAGPVFKFVLGLLLMVAMTAGGLVYLFRALGARESARQVSGVLRPPSGREFPLPRLQVTPAKDLAAFRQDEDQVLEGWGLVDPDKGLARIPVQEAMSLVAARGLPEWKPAAATQAAAAQGTAQPPTASRGVPAAAGRRP